MPFPLIPLITGGLSALGGIFGGASKGRAEGRAAEADIQGRNDLLRMQAARMMEEALQGRAGLNLQQRQFQLQAPGQRAGNSVRGDVLANAQDASIQGPITGTGGRMPTISGGLRPSLMSGNTRQLGQGMSRNALMQQMQGDRFEPLPPINMPEITPMPQAGKLDSFLNILGGIGTGVGALNEAGVFARRPPRVPQIPGGFQIPRIPGPVGLEEPNF